MEKLTAVLLSCIGLLIVVSLVDGSCTCNINHPQERYCKANFSFVGTVMEVREIKHNSLSFVEYTVKISRSTIYKGRRFLSGDRNRQPILTPYYGSLCGRSNLEMEQKYLFTGSVENGVLMISFCNWIPEWERVTSTQRKYLREGVYDQNCGCKITGTNKRERYDQNLHSDFVSDIQFSGLWTQRKCHYNPLASSHFRSRDCETDESYCAMDENTGFCLWKWTNEYSKCFQEREQLWQVVNGAQPAFTRRRQCREISIPKLKKMCRRSLLRQKKAERQLKKEALLEDSPDQDEFSYIGLDLDI